MSHEGPSLSHSRIRDDYIVCACVSYLEYSLKLNLFILVRLVPKYLILMNKTRRSLRDKQIPLVIAECSYISIAGDLSESNVEYKNSFLFYLPLIVRTSYRSGNTEDE